MTKTKRKLKDPSFKFYLSQLRKHIAIFTANLRLDLRIYKVDLKQNLIKTWRNKRTGRAVIEFILLFSMGCSYAYLFEQPLIQITILISFSFFASLRCFYFIWLGRMDGEPIE